MDMEVVKNLKGAQRLIGCLATLNRFISCLREQVNVGSLGSAHKAEGVPHYTIDPDLPLAGETLLLYTAATPHTVSVALVVEREEEGHILMVQRSVYFISKVVSDSKAHYLRIQKLLYTMLIAKRKLWHYFDAHHVVVMSSSGLGDVINNQESISGIAKWGLYLMGLDITYAPCTTIMSQALADFIMEWTMYFDGSLTLERAGMGVLLISPSGDKMWSQVPGLM
ncbi:uncharacterized protein [Miscanthus floridulus]|uniref:uncharacterized protein n=1 Tax=Miscanthus floridulus TaxID=154761 RepID=UPI00345841FC